MRTVTIEKDGNNYSVNPNASSGGATIAYAWCSNIDTVYVDFNIAPNEVTGAKMLIVVSSSDKIERMYVEPATSGTDYTKISDTSFSIGSTIYTRDSSKDFTLW